MSACTFAWHSISDPVVSVIAPVVPIRCQTEIKLNFEIFQNMNGAKRKPHKSPILWTNWAWLIEPIKLMHQVFTFCLWMYTVYTCFLKYLTEPTYFETYNKPQGDSEFPHITLCSLKGRGGLNDSALKVGNDGSIH